ncbi:MAG: hypothetical protein JEZ08_10550 [Clostridiales bacterium]|nr:hypothetical protein [Clostridiales bacterium]
MKHLVLFLGERDLLYTQLSETLNDAEVETKIFDSSNLKKVFDDHVNYLDLSNKEVIEDFVNKECYQYEAVTLVVSDDYQWRTNNVDEYVTTVERLLYGTVFTIEALTKRSYKNINIVITVNSHHNVISIKDGLYPTVFEHINRWDHPLNTYLIYLEHDKAYSIDSYAKIEFGYTYQDEEKLKVLLNTKINKVTRFIMSVINEKHDIRSSISYIKD